MPFRFAPFSSVIYLYTPNSIHMPLFFIVLLAVYVIGNVYIFIRGWQTLSLAGKGIKAAYTALFLLLASCFVIQFAMRDTEFGPALGHGLHVAGTSWLVFSFYMMLWLVLMEIIAGAAWFVKARWRKDPARYKQFRVKSYWEGFLLIVCILSIGYYRYQHPFTEVVNIVINKPLDSEQKELKVVAVSDIHLGYGTDKKQLQKYIRLIQAQKPDLILIGGDLIDNSLVPVREEKMEEELSLLKAPLGVYAIAGNHEYISNIGESVKFLKETPVTLLRDSAVTLSNGIQIIGRDDRHNRRRKKLSELTGTVDKQKPVILLDHQPYGLHETEEEHIDLQFSGHTHRGQIWPLSLLTDRMFELSHGMKKAGDTHIYVSSGLSLWGPPFRIGTRSELVVFNICFN